MLSLTPEFLQLTMLTAKQACEVGGNHALSYFKSGLQAEQKDDSSPVTIADRESELKIIQTIQKVFPEHSILGEESGLLAGDPRFRWIIDPIDGTRGFIRGGGFWGSLIGLEYQDKIVVGAMCLPVPQISFWAAQDLGCYRNGHRIFLREEDQLSQATLSLGEIQYILKSPYAQGLTEVIRGCASSRGYGDPGGLMMVLDGLADVWIEGGVKAWDLAHAKILIEEAGGIFTDFEGEATIHSGNAIACRKNLHRQVMEAFKKGE